VRTNLPSSTLVAEFGTIITQRSLPNATERKGNVDGFRLCDTRNLTTLVDLHSHLQEYPKHFSDDFTLLR
jgi:hypothetical protein